MQQIYEFLKALWLEAQEKEVAGDATAPAKLDHLREQGQEVPR